MRKLSIVAAVLIPIVFGLNQTTAQKKPEPSEEENDKIVQRYEARQKDFRRALSISKPKIRIQALKKLLVTYADDAEVPRLVDEGILDTYIKYWPLETAQISLQIDRLLKGIPKDTKYGSGNNIYAQLATKLVDAGILPDRAEELALKGLSSFDTAKFIQAQKVRREHQLKWIELNKNVEAVLKTDLISEDEMLKMAAAERAKALTTLGRVYLLRGKSADAEKLLKEAYSANPDIIETNIALAEISLASGDHAAVVEHLSAVAVRTPINPKLRQQLEESYRKTHQGSLEKLEEMLDAKYRLLMPNPLQVKPYQPTASRSGRLVLAEVFTGSGCVPCVGADLAFEAAVDRYSNKNIALLMYHLHRPLPDPLVNSASLARASFYGIERTPGFTIDGEKNTQGGAIREKAQLVYDRVQPAIEKRLETNEEADITLETALDKHIVKVKVTVNNVKSDSKNLRLNIALAENELRYVGENLVRIHPMVVRSLAYPGVGLAINRAGPTVVEYAFDTDKISANIKSYLDDYEVNGDYGPINFKEKKWQLDVGNLSVVAFVQDPIAKRILQSSYSRVKFVKPVAAASTEADEKEFELRWKAETQARRLSDPNKRIAAFRKMLVDFPNDPPVAQVEQGILDTYLEFWPEQTEKILNQIDKVLAPIRSSKKLFSGNNLYNQVAVKLLNAGVLLDTAEKLASQGLALFDEQEFRKRQKQMFVSFWKAPVPADDDLSKRFRAERAKLLTTLGLIYLKQHRQSEGENILKEAYAANKTISEANLALAEMALKVNDNSAALEYLSSAAVSDPLKPEWRSRLEAVYRGAHAGSLSGLEELLDQKYRELMPNPISIRPYVPDDGRTDRVVLAELFTGAGCIPCVAMDLSFEAAMHRYSDKEIAVLIYHLHIPQPDPMTNPSGISRADFYKINGTPRAVIDAAIYDEGGGPRDRAWDVYNHVQPMIEKELESPARAQINLNTKLEEMLVRVEARVEQVKSESKHLRLCIALVENELQYGGENRVRIHPMVVRSLAGPIGSPGGGFQVDPVRGAHVSYTFDLRRISAEIKTYLDRYEVSGKHGRIRFRDKKYLINRDNLSVVAFVQDQISKQVLQATSVRVRPTSPISTPSESRIAKGQSR